MELSEHFYNSLVNFLAFTVGFIHQDHVATLFENDRRFSHLSEIEREMSFRTEMGMYYYYYKVIVESPSWTDGMQKIWNDTHSQYPSAINAQTTYNIFPEIVAGFLYHKAKSFNLFYPPKCWNVKRGYGLTTVTSCEGAAVQSYFYIQFVWYFAVLTGALLFLYAFYLSQSICGGFIATLSFFFNFTECTRVQWTPPLRESFAYPFLLWQMYFVTVVLDKDKREEEKKFKWKDIFDNFFFWKIFPTTTISLACWQFSQFIFTTQLICLLILHWMQIVPRNLLLKIAATHGLSILINCSFGNHSIFSISAALVVGIFYSDNINTRLENVFSPIWLVFTNIISTIFFTYFHIYYRVVTTEDYDHVLDILRAKLTNYKDFHTLLYTCSAEFDFLPYKNYEVIIETLLLPTAILAGFLAIYFWYRNYKIMGYPDCIEPGIAYNGLQTGAFIIMAVMIMRLKLFMNSHLCIMASCVVNKKYLMKLGIKTKSMRIGLLIALIFSMGYHGFTRFLDEFKYSAEYKNVKQEELFEWIKTYTPPHAVFAGKMSVMANLLLSTGRPIVNNPFYESKEMRDRTLKVYEVYSRKDAASVYKTIRDMQVDYLVLDGELCYGHGNAKPGCRMIDLWDLTDNGEAKRLGKRSLCRILFSGDPHPFKNVFANDYYVVLKLDYSTYVEFKPKVLLLRS